MTDPQEVLTGEESGDGWQLVWTTWLLPGDDGRWWWQVDAHRTGTMPPRDNDERPPFWQAMDAPVVVVDQDGVISGDLYPEGTWLGLDGGTLDYGAGMGAIWNGPCDSRDEALAAAHRFIGMGRP